MVMYHGTPSSETIQEFRVPEKGGARDEAVWFTPSKAYAGTYARRNAQPDDTSILVGAQKKKILPVYLSIQNPLDLRDNIQRGRFLEALKLERKDGGRTRIEVAKSLGHDGMITSIGEYLVFSPTQIKSVFNRGTWDAADPRIAYNYLRGNPAVRSTINGVASVFPDAEHLRLYRLGVDLLDGKNPEPAEAQAIFKTFKGYVGEDENAPAARHGAEAA